MNLRASRISLALIVLLVVISGSAVASSCECTCICNNTCPADGWLPHRTYATHETYFSHCSTDSHRFWDGLLYRRCDYDQKFKHMYYECDWCGATCTHGGTVDHECGHDVRCGSNYVACPD